VDLNGHEQADPDEDSDNPAGNLDDASFAHGSHDEVAIDQFLTLIYRQGTHQRVAVPGTAAGEDERRRPVLIS
jgi:hypothetical protein